MIGLLGPFGVGKSTVIEMLASGLKKDKNRAVVRISAERHETSGFHRSFLFALGESIVEEDLAKRQDVDAILDELRYAKSESAADFGSSLVAQVWTQLKGPLRRLRKILAISLGIVAGGIAIASVVASVLNVNIWTPTFSVIASIGLWAAGFLPVFLLIGQWASGGPLNTLTTPGRKDTTAPRVEAADEYERVFAALVDRASECLIIAVDDIDRMPAREVLVGLNIVRSFQLSCAREKRPIFVVSVDEEVVKTAISPIMSSSKGSSAAVGARLADDYLNRLFTRRQQMPEHTRGDLNSYALASLRRVPHTGAIALGGSLDAVVTVLIHDAVTDPRHVVRLLNAYFGDFRLASLREGRVGHRGIAAGEVTSHPLVLARLTVMRCDFGPHFALVVKNLELLDSIAREQRGEMTLEDKRLLRTSGIRKVGGYERFAAYVARTAGWAEPVDDLLPFIYLGQDEVDRTLGSKDAKRVRTILSNAQRSEFRRLVDEADSEDRLVALRNFIVASLNELKGLELGNALSTVFDGLAGSKLKGDRAIADAVASVVPQVPKVDAGAESIFELADGASRLHSSGLLMAASLRPLVSSLAHTEKLVDAKRRFDGAGASDLLREYVLQEIAGIPVNAPSDELVAWLSMARGLHELMLVEPMLLGILAPVGTLEESDSGMPDVATGLANALKVGGDQVTISAVESAVRTLIRAKPESIVTSRILEGLAAISLESTQSVANLVNVVIRLPYSLGDETERQLRRDASAAFVVRALPVVSRFTTTSDPRVHLSKSAGEYLAALVVDAGAVQSWSRDAILVLLAPRPADADPLVSSVSDALAATSSTVDSTPAELEALLDFYPKYSKVSKKRIQALLESLADNPDSDIHARAYAAIAEHIADDPDWASDLYERAGQRISTGTAADVQNACGLLLTVAGGSSPTEQQEARLLAYVQNGLAQGRNRPAITEFALDFPWTNRTTVAVAECLAPYWSETPAQSGPILAGWLEGANTPVSGALQTVVDSELLTTARDGTYPRAKLLKLVRHLSPLTGMQVLFELRGSRSLDSAKPRAW